ncbi:MAG: hypothetical protein U0Z44_06100 [Kouleothrix sp.]
MVEEQIELGAGAAVELGHAAVRNHQAGRRVEWAVGDDQAGLGPRLDERLAVDRAIVEDGKSGRNAT